MEISKAAWNNYIQKLSRIDKLASETVLEYIQNYENYFDQSFEYTKDQMKELVDYAYSVSNRYGEAAASLSCEMYDAIAEASGKMVEAAVPAETAPYSDVAKAVYGTGKYKNENLISNSVGRLVKRTGADTMLNNSLRDGAQFAWVPNGDTCAFCIALASRGWQYVSKETLKNGHAEHIHANCDCTYAVRFNPNTQVAGYDPKVYEDMYYGADGRSPEAKLNSLRNMLDAKNRDKINAQKRIAYAKRQALAMKKNASTSWTGGARQNTGEQIKELIEYASGKGIVLDESFQSFDGDISLAKDFVDKMDEIINSMPHAKKKNTRLGVSYSMDDDVYAETKNASITINGFAYRNREALEKDYLKKVQEKWFTDGSTYLDIATHESAHVMAYLNQAKRSGLTELFFGKNEIESSKAIAERISRYALANDDELIAESYVKYSNGSKDDIVLKILQYCGIL